MLLLSLGVKRSALLAAFTLLCLTYIFWHHNPRVPTIESLPFHFQAPGDIGNKEPSAQIGSSPPSTLNPGPIQDSSGAPETKLPAEPAKPAKPASLNPPTGEPYAGNRANSTLGFGSIVATSIEDQNDPKSWRRKGLLAAADRTGLRIEIPPPIYASSEEIDFIMTVGNGPFPKKGSAYAYHAHLKKLQRFLASGLETMLLLEDDADWELDIRDLLAPEGNIATGIRNSTNATQDPMAYPYGREWDLLWLGHCGFESMRPNDTVVMDDPGTLPLNQLKGLLGKAHYKTMANHTREVHTRVAAMCTFGIGISRPWAEAFLANVHRGGTKGVDYSTHIKCKGGMRCVGVLPELIHHQKALGGGYTTEIEKVNIAAGSKKVEVASEDLRFYTLDLMYSARCNANLTEAEGRRQCLPSEEDWKKYDT